MDEVIRGEAEQPDAVQPQTHTDAVSGASTGKDASSGGAVRRDEPTDISPGKQLTVGNVPAGSSAAGIPPGSSTGSAPPGSSRGSAPAASSSSGGSIPPVFHASLAEGLWHSRELIFGCAIVAAVAALIVGVFTPRRYEARVTVLAEPRKEYDVGQLDIKSQQERQAFLETQKELVVSRTVVAETLAELKGVQPDQVTAQQAEDFLRNVTVTSRHGLGKGLFGGSGIAESNVFFILVRAGDPKDAARAANALVSRYLGFQNRLRARIAATALSVLQGATVESSRHTADAHTRMAEIEESSGDLLPYLMDAEKETLPVLPELQQIRASYEAERANIELQKARVSSLRKALETTGGVVLASDVLASNAAINRLKAQLADLDVEITKQLQVFNESSREVSNIREQAKLVEKLLRQEVERVVAGEQERLSGMEQAQEARRATLSEYHDRVTSLSQVNSRYVEAKRVYRAEAKAQQALMEGTATAQAAAADRSAQSANIAVIDGAVPDSRPVSPQVGRNTLLAGVLGLLSGFLLALLRLPPSVPLPGGRRATD